MPGSIWIAIIRDGHQDFANLWACTFLKDDHYVAVVEAVVNDLGVKQRRRNSHTIEECLKCLFELLGPGFRINGEGAVNNFHDMGWTNRDIGIRWIPTIHRHPGKLRSWIYRSRELIDRSHREVGLFATGKWLTNWIFGRCLQRDGPRVNSGKERPGVDVGCPDTLFRLCSRDDSVLLRLLSSSWAQREAEKQSKSDDGFPSQHTHPLLCKARCICSLPYVPLQASYL